MSVFLRPLLLCSSHFPRTMMRSMTTPPSFSREVNDRLIKGTALDFFLGTEFDKHNLTALFENNIRAIVIPNFIDRKICAIAVDKLVFKGIEEYTNAPGIGRVGISYFETTDNPEIMEKYFEEAPQNRKIVRTLFSPYESPLDKLKCILDEIWPKAVSLEVKLSAQTNLSGKMFAGLIRSLDHGKGILPHEDKRERDDSTMPLLQAQIAANVYLQNPEQGGELELYNLSLDTERYDRWRGKSYGIDRLSLPPPVMKIKPKDGDLILFNSRNLHSVTDAIGRKRISISTFIGHDSDGSLKLWS